MIDNVKRRLQEISALRGVAVHHTARIEYDERRAKAFAYQSGGECFAVLPIAGENGATIVRLKPLTAAQWRARMIGRR